MPRILKTLRLMLWAGLSVLMPARARAAAPDFTPGNQVLLTSAAPQAVVAISGGFRLYYVQDGFRVMSATTTDQAAWSTQSGTRVSTGAIADLDASSITSCGVYITTDATVGMRMFYVGISTAGRYSVLSATSTDGLTWSKESGTRLQVNGGLGFVESPKPIPIAGGGLRLFYVADSAGGNNPTNYRIFSASSTDGGRTFQAEGQVLSDRAFQVAVSTLTDGRTRIHYSAPLGAATTATQVLSAVSTNGLAFSGDGGVRLSTLAANASLTHPVVFRATETFRWRMLSSYTPSGSSTPYASSALTMTPLVTTMDPSVMLKSQSSTQFTLTGEVFAPSASVTFTIGSDTMTAFNLTRPDDQTLTGFVDPFGKALGHWYAVAANPDGGTGALFQALFIDVAPGSLTILDNLFRPLRGQTAKITAKVFGSGRLTLKLYTLNGGLVATLMDHEVSEGDHNVTWAGRTSAGNLVASGVYFLRATGPKLDVTEKIVVIK